MRRRPVRVRQSAPAMALLPSRPEGTPASPAVRPFARTSSGGLGGPGLWECSNTLHQPEPRRGCPCLDPFGASVQPCTRFGTGHGWWVWLRHARRPQAPLRGHRTVGDHGAGGVTVTARVCSGFASMAEVGARCPTFLEQARSWPCSFRRRLAERLRPIGEETRRPLAATRGRERSRALFVGGRHSSSARSRSPFTRQARKGGVGLGGGCRRKASHRRDTRSARGSLGTRPSGRERRSGGRSAGRSG